MQEYVVIVDYKDYAGMDYQQPRVYSFRVLANANEYAAWERANDDVRAAYVYKKVG